jgi:hypothetical protein
MYTKIKKRIAYGFCYLLFTMAYEEKYFMIDDTSDIKHFYSFQFSV